MNNASNYSIGLMHEFALELAKASFSSDEVMKLKEHDLRCIRLAWECLVTIEFREHLSNQGPCMPGGLNLYRHITGNEWDAGRAQLWFPRENLTHDPKLGTIMAKSWLGNRKVFNANILDYLLANQHLIPKKWIGKQIFFVGTLFSNPPDSTLWVRTMVQHNQHWTSSEKYYEYYMKENDAIAFLE